MFLFSRPYQRQILALLPAYLTMVCGGMFLAYGVFNIFIGYQSWTVGISTPAMFFIAGSYHIAVVFGSIPVAFIYKLVEVKKLHIMNSLLMATASIILIVMPNSYAGVVTSRTLFGLGFGSSLVTFILYASEISSPKVRALSFYSLHLFLTLGMFLFTIFSLGSNLSLALRITGSFTLALTAISAALGYFTMKSSHIWMMQNNSKDALERFQFFQQDSTENPHVESEAMQNYIIEEKKRCYNFFGKHNSTALVVVLLVKIGYLSVFNALHNIYRAVLLSAFLTIGDTNYTPMIMMGTRLCGCIAGFFLLDRITKRLQYFIPAVIISFLLFIFGILLVIYQSLYIWTPMIFFIPLEFFLGIGLSPIADILKGELFPLKEKPVSIATTIVLEEVIHIMCIILLYSWVLSLGSVPRTLTFIFGAITLVFGFGVFFLLRDSRKQSLRLVANLYSDKQ